MLRRGKWSLCIFGHRKLRKLGKISRFKNKHNNAYNAPGRKSVANKMRNIFFPGQRPGMSFKTQSSPPKFPGGVLGKKDW